MAKKNPDPPEPTKSTSYRIKVSTTVRLGIYCDVTGIDRQSFVDDAINEKLKRDAPADFDRRVEELRKSVEGGGVKRGRKA